MFQQFCSGNRQLPMGDVNADVLQYSILFQEKHSESRTANSNVHHTGVP